MPPGVKEGMGFPDFFGILPVLVQVQAQGVVCAVAAVLRDGGALGQPPETCARG